MNLLTNPSACRITSSSSAILFVCGVVCMATKRNVLGVLMGIELVLNGANLNLSPSAARCFAADGGTRSGWTAR